MFIKNITICTLVCSCAHLSLHAMEQMPLQKVDLALITAAKGNNLEKVNKKLQLGASINPKDAATTALIEACSQEFDNEKLVEVLLENEADPNLPNKDLATPMHFAVQRNKAGVLTLLQKAGANPNAQDKDGNTPWHKATSLQALNAMSWLHSSGADANVLNKAGLSPLHIAVLESKICSYAILPRWGARLDIVSEPSAIPNPALTLSPGSTVFHASTQIEVFGSCMQKSFISHALFNTGDLSSKALFSFLCTLHRECPGLYKLRTAVLMPYIAKLLSVQMLTALLRSSDKKMINVGKNVLRQRSATLQGILRKTDGNNETALMKETQKNGNVQSPKTLLDPTIYDLHFRPFVAALRTNTLHKLPNTNVFKVAYESALPRKEEAKPAPQAKTTSDGSCVIC